MPSTKESTEELKNQFNNFSSIELVSKAANLIEKIFWISIAIGGTAWICGFVLYDQTNNVLDGESTIKIHFIS